MQIYNVHKVKHAWIGGVISHQVDKWGVLMTDIGLGHKMTF